MNSQQLKDDLYFRLADRNVPEPVARYLIFGSEAFNDPAFAGPDDDDEALENYLDVLEWAYTGGDIESAERTAHLLAFELRNRGR